MDANVVERLADANVLVVGDVLLDRFVEGRVTRISREAPVPVLPTRACASTSAAPAMPRPTSCPTAAARRWWRSPASRRGGGRAQGAVPRLPAPDRAAGRRRQPADDGEDPLPLRLAAASLHRRRRRPAGRLRCAAALVETARGAGGLRRAGHLRLRARRARRHGHRRADRRGARRRQAGGGRSAPRRRLGLCRRHGDHAQYRGDAGLLRHPRPTATRAAIAACRRRLLAAATIDAVLSHPRRGRHDAGRARPSPGACCAPRPTACST